MIETTETKKMLRVISYCLHVVDTLTVFSILPN